MTREMTEHADGLLSCPICHSHRVARVGRGESYNFRGNNYYRGYIKCMKCGCTGGIGKSPEQANNLWNHGKKRNPSDIPQGRETLGEQK